MAPDRASRPGARLSRPMTVPDPTARLRVDDFDYTLPAAAIAQVPVEPRDAARLLVLDRADSRPRTRAVAHHTFAELGALLRPGDLLVVNDSRVIAARLHATRDGGGEAELLMLRPIEDRSGRWEALLRPSRKVDVGAVLSLSSGDRVEVGERLTAAEAGEMPLPPYIHDRSSPAGRYQTIYADPPGSAAAPTAGLHFTTDLLASMPTFGVRVAALTLHVGLDTFRPLEGEFVDQHRIHREWYELPATTTAAIDETRAHGGRVVAVGTTTVRVLETAARGGATSGWSDLYITPPFPFRTVGALITNFHLPRSSLLLLVTAFVQAGMGAASPSEARDVLLDAYRVALEEGYRFFSFGDAMLIV